MLVTIAHLMHLSLLVSLEEVTCIYVHVPHPHPATMQIKGLRHVCRPDALVQSARTDAVLPMVPIMDMKMPDSLNRDAKNAMLRLSHAVGPLLSLPSISRPLALWNSDEYSRPYRINRQIVAGSMLPAHVS
ncbi:hypothetical protein V8F33_004152 [Rhypophila sp. PSN 637]